MSQQFTFSLIFLGFNVSSIGMWSVNKYLHDYDSPIFNECLLDTYWSTFDGMWDRFNSILLCRIFLYKLQRCDELRTNTNENYSIMSLLLAVIALSLIVFIPSALAYNNYIFKEHYNRYLKFLHVITFLKTWHNYLLIQHY